MRNFVECPLCGQKLPKIGNVVHCPQCDMNFLIDRRSYNNAFKEWQE